MVDSKPLWSKRAWSFSSIPLTTSRSGYDFFGHLSVPRNGFFWPRIWPSCLPSQLGRMVFQSFSFFRLAICCLKTEDFISGAILKRDSAECLLQMGFRTMIGKICSRFKMIRADWKKVQEMT